jgi:transcriptional regulator with XRE-family HTH domain
MNPEHVFDQDTIAYRLRTARHRASLSQRDLAAPGVSYAYISRIEAGVRTPSTKALRRIADRFAELGAADHFVGGEHVRITAEWLETGVQPLEVEGPLTDRLVRDLLERARASGIKGRAKVRVRVEQVTA